MHYWYLVTVITAWIFFSCNTSDDSFYIRKGKVYENSYMRINIPQTYHVDTFYSDIGFRVLEVKNSIDQMVMHFYGGLHTDHNTKYDVNLLTENFELNNEVDTIGNYYEKPGEKRLVNKKIIVLQAKRQVDSTWLPIIVEFNCYPDYAEPHFCENVVSSAKVKHLLTQGNKFIKSGI